MGVMIMDSIRHFLDLDRLDTATLREIISLGAAYKRGETPGGVERPLAGKTLAMVFEKPSTRTRVSFEVGMRQLGGEVVTLGQTESQLGRGETIADTARVLSRYVDAIMIRTGDEAHLLDMAANASVPVINGLTNRTHPCQLMADVLTFEEHRGPIGGKVVAWVGDGNNVAISWIHAAARFGFTLRLACPKALTPPEALVKWANEEGAGKGGRVSVITDTVEAVKEADCVVTDTWVPMNIEDGERRRRLLASYQVNEALMEHAGKEAIFLHCLPAHRGEEVTDAVLDGPQSRVWDEAENRLHAQKGILTWCLR